METQQITRRETQQAAAPPLPEPSAELNAIQDSCRRLADAADAEIEQALSGGLRAEQFLESARQMRGGQ